ncbi:MAG: hypothetical protein HZA51_08595 [Planctomycetes bacterium]|nr:hypothetical protein [Planctomycetota bacterium]
MNATRLNDLMRELYRDVDATVAAHQPVCTNRGACCKFKQFGHRLYVTDVELAYFSEGMKHAWKPVVTDESCPYQIDGMCTAREHRPLGCRIYFCDENAQSWQSDEYERFLSRLKAIGEDVGIAYRYREWLSALSEVATPESAMPAIPETGPSVDGIRLPVIE